MYTYACANVCTLLCSYTYKVNQEQLGGVSEANLSSKVCSRFEQGVNILTRIVCVRHGCDSLPQRVLWERDYKSIL